MEDVVIIGAGPTGNFLAAKLASKGYRVTVLEERHVLGNPVCCAGIISESAFKTIGIDQIPILSRFNKAALFSPGQHRLEIRRSQTQAVTIDRGLADKLMAEKAMRQGAVYRLGCRVTGINKLSQSMEIICSRQSSVEARLVVLACGFNPSLTRMFTGRSVADFAVGAQVRVETREPGELELYTGRDFSPGFFSWFQPAGDNTALVGTLARGNVSKVIRRFSRFIEAKKGVTPVGKPCFRGVSLCPLPVTYANRVLVVGDAAGQVKPLTGGGIYYGLVACQAALNTIERAFSKDRFSARNLSDYQKRWQKIILGDIRISRLVRRLYQSLSDRQIDRLFHSLERSGLADRLAGDLKLSFDDHGRAIFKSLLTPAFYSSVVHFISPVRGKRLENR